MDQYNVWIGNIHCSHASDGQGNQDQLYVLVKYNGSQIGRWPASGYYDIGAGDTVFAGVSIDLPGSGPPTQALAIEVWDHDTFSPDDLIGSAPLSTSIDSLGTFTNLISFRQDGGVYDVDAMVYGPGTVVIAPTNLAFSVAPANGLVFEANLVGAGSLDLNTYPMLILSDSARTSYNPPSVHLPISRDANLVRFSCRDSGMPWATIDVNTLAQVRGGLPPATASSPGEASTLIANGANELQLTYTYLYPQGALIRREVNKLTSVERARWTRAVNALKNNAPKLFPNAEDKSYDDYIELHKYYGQTTSSSVLLAHGNATFLTWHRAFCWRFEQTLRRYDPSIALPYWDWTLPGADLTGTALVALVGGWPVTQLDPPNPTGPVANGPFATNWEVEFRPSWPPKLRKKQLLRGRNGALPTLSEVRHVLGETTYDSAPYTNFEPPFAGFRQMFEFGPHGRAHVFVGGQLSSVPLAPSDPLFWLHHCHVDRVFETWLGLQKRRSQPLYAPRVSGPAGTNLADHIEMLGFGTMPTHGEVLEIGASLRMEYIYDTLFSTKGPIVEEIAEDVAAPRAVDDTPTPETPAVYELIGAPALGTGHTVQFTDAIMPNPYTEPMRIVELTMLPVDVDETNRTFELRTYAPGSNDQVTVAGRVTLALDRKQRRRQFVPIEPPLALPVGYSVGFSSVGGAIGVPSMPGSGQTVYLSPIAGAQAGTYTLGPATQVMTNGWNVTCVPPTP